MCHKWYCGGWPISDYQSVPFWLTAITSILLFLPPTRPRPFREGKGHPTLERPLVSSSSLSRPPVIRSNTERSIQTGAERVTRTHRRLKKKKKAAPELSVFGDWLAKRVSISILLYPITILYHRRWKLKSVQFGLPRRFCCHHFLVRSLIIETWQEGNPSGFRDAGVWLYDLVSFDADSNTFCRIVDRYIFVTLEKLPHMLKARRSLFSTLQELSWYYFMRKPLMPPNCMDPSPHSSP